MPTRNHSSKMPAWRALLAMPLLALCSIAARAAPLTVGYSDWPGWVAWQVAIEKGWFKEAGVDVKFEWFDYSASMEAFAAGKLDAVTMTNGDALVTGSGGGKSVMLMLTDYSNGNDVLVAKAPVKTVKDLKGKKVSVEAGLVEHLLLLNALKKNGMKESDVTIVNAKTNEMPQVFAQVPFQRILQAFVSYEVFSTSLAGEGLDFLELDGDNEVLFSGVRLQLLPILFLQGEARRFYFTQRLSKVDVDAQLIEQDQNLRADWTFAINLYAGLEF